MLQEVCEVLLEVRRREARHVRAISVLGARVERTSFVIDVTDEHKTLRQLFSCNSNPAPLPGCPNGATF